MATRCTYNKIPYGSLRTHHPLRRATTPVANMRASKGSAPMLEGIMPNVVMPPTSMPPWTAAAMVDAPAIFESGGTTACSRQRAVKCFGWVFFLISSGSPHVHPMGRTCGEPDEIELTAMGVKLNGSRRVPWHGNVVPAHVHVHPGEEQEPREEPARARVCVVAPHHPLLRRPGYAVTVTTAVTRDVNNP